MKRLLQLFSVTMLFVTSLFAQTISQAILPQYMEGIASTNLERIPCAYRLTVTGLKTSATYRYLNQFVITSDAATAGGAGNIIFAKTDGTDFVRTSSPSFSTSGAYGTFKTDASGAYTGWFITEPTGNAARMIPGKYVFIRLTLNDGADGTTAALRATTSDSIKIIKPGATATDTAGTVLTGFTSNSAKNFVALYDNVAGTGRPIAVTFTESDGTANTVANSYTSAYATTVDGVKGAFGTIIPNILANGIRRAELRSLTTGEIISVATDSDGKWASGANTVNPAGGKTAISLTVKDIPLDITGKQSSTVPEKFELQQNYPNPFNPSTLISWQITTGSQVTLKVYSLLGKEITTLVDGYKPAGSYNSTFNTQNSSLTSGIYFYTLRSGNYSLTKKMMLIK